MEIKRDENGNPKKAPFSLQVDLSKFNSAMFEKASDEEKSQQDVMSESTTFFKDGMRKLFRNPLAVGSIIVLSLILLVIIFAPLFVPYRYEEILAQVTLCVISRESGDIPAPGSPSGIPR